MREAADEANEAEKRERAEVTSAGVTCGKARHPLTTRTLVHSQGFSHDVTRVDRLK
jgi:hypothetical protein